MQGWAWEPEPVGMSADAKDAVPGPLLGVNEHQQSAGESCRGHSAVSLSSAQEAHVT